MSSRDLHPFYALLENTVAWVVEKVVEFFVTLKAFSAEDDKLKEHDLTNCLVDAKGVVMLRRCAFRACCLCCGISYTTQFAYFVKQAFLHGGMRVNDKKETKKRGVIDLNHVIDSGV